MGLSVPIKSPYNVLNQAVDELIKSRLPYVVALLPYLYFEGMYWANLSTCTSSSLTPIEGSKVCLDSYILKAKEENIKYTLSSAFNRMIAENVYVNLEEKIHKPLVEMSNYVELKDINDAIKGAIKRLKG